MTGENHAISNAKGWLEEMRRMTAAIVALGDDDAAHDEAQLEIEESALSVQVRGGWYNLGDEAKGGAPEEFEILLTTGGPALRITGDLDQYGQPENPRLQWQDWGTPWTDYRETSDEDKAALAAFVGCFYFGE